ncbi:glycoside hydrolase family 3 protein [Clostridium estertheticum]|uniref:glycoside hydrolase family 3 protein n=1 Tax=Clostridium estertheticum TaxID=238834 RepID=UPI0013E992AA|nr:glycoside hydrolase family 3 protein [Clostridium estertheticum]MBZ9687075.1 glycoside hydrolase family 3 protein [Clostridium estertheticum]
MSTKLNELTLDQKIGQLLLVGFPRSVLNEDFKELIKNYHIGNVIVFQRNIKDSLQLAGLDNSIQKLMDKHNSVPAFIGIDQEGGMVTRLFKKATFFPGNMAIAAGIPWEEAFELGAAVGEELHDVGVNMNFAPVLDVNNNPGNPVIGVRSYGDSPERVAQYGKHLYKGLQSEKVLSCGKHFPGHGNTNVDSHFGIPIISSDLSELKKVELVPFIEAINSGIDGIMTSHILFSALEKNNLPATLSKTILTGLLKEELGFKGLVITDCMEMKAINDNYGIEDAVIKALNAGADLLCISHTKELQIGAFNAIKKAVEAGIISNESLDSKVEKILYFKEKYDLYNWRNLSGKINEEQLKRHSKLAAAISEKSITLIKDQKLLLPLKNEGLISITPISQATSIADDEIEKANLGKVLESEIGCEYINYDLKEIDEDYIISKVSNKKTIVFGSYNMNLNKSQKNLLNRLIASGKDIVLVALRNPYDISDYINEISTILCTYEYTKLSVSSLVKVLKGEISSKGRLPIKVENY